MKLYALKDMAHTVTELLDELVYFEESSGRYLLETKLRETKFWVDYFIEQLDD